MNKNPPQKPEKQNIVDQVAEENTATEETPRRRIQDGITSKNPTRKMNLDRRLKNHERRSNSDSDYKGPSRRYTIDRRQTNKDRRGGSD